MKALILKNPLSFNVQKVAHVLAELRRIPLGDAAQAANKNWGLLAEDLGDEEVIRWAEHFNRVGLETCALNKENLVVLPEVEYVGSGSFEPSAIRIRLKKGDSLDLDSSNTLLIAAAALEESTSVTIRKTEGPSAGQKLASMGILLTTGLPIRIGPKKQTVEKKQMKVEPFFVLDIYGAPILRRFRIDARAFDFSLLGNKKQYGSAANFKSLVSEWLTKIPGIAKNHGAEVLYSKRPLGEAHYPSLDHLDRESRWLLSLGSRL